MDILIHMLHKKSLISRVLDMQVVIPKVITTRKIPTQRVEITPESQSLSSFSIPKLGTDCTKSNTDFNQKTKGSNHKLNAQKLHLIHGKKCD